MAGAMLGLRPRLGLTRYVAAAGLARTADGGSVVAVVLVVTTSGAPGWLAGLLGASITAPHLLGPFIARGLDTARDGRVVIAVACLIHGAALAAAVLVYPVLPTVITEALLIISGLFGPFLTGGISSRLPAIVGNGSASQRRAQGWDVATYGLGGTIGPTLVAILSVWSTPTVAALVLAAGTFAAALVIRFLPHQAPTPVSAEIPKPWQTLKVMTASGQLRRTLYLTVVVALSVAALPITAVAFTIHSGAAASVGALLTGAYGLGNLAGSAGIMIRPLRGEADLLTTRFALVVAVALAAALLATPLPLAIAVYLAAGISNAYFFAATLAARSEYSPTEVRGQVFVWVGALKITAGSAGTALAGALIVVIPHLPLIVAAALTAATAVTSIADRRREPASAWRPDA